MDKNQPENKESENFQQDAFAWQVIEALGQGVTIIDANGRFTYVNPAYARMVGRPPEELIGKFPLDFTHPDDRETLQQARQQRRSNQATTYETRLLRPDGRVIHAQITGVPRRQNGNVIGAFTIVTDVTERKEAQARLQQEKQLSEAIIDSLPGAFYIFDDAGRLVRWNKRMETISGYTAAEMAEPLDFIAPADRTAVAGAIQAVFTEGQAAVEAKFLFKDGRQQPYLFTGHRFLIDGRPHLIGVGLDISDRVAAEEALHQSQQRLHTVIDNAPIILWTVDAQGIFSLSSGQGLAALGLEPGQLVGQSLFDTFGPQVPELEARFQQALAGAESALTLKLGEAVFATRYAPLHNQVGTITGVVGIALNITDRVEAEEALRASEERYRSLVNSVGDIIFQTDTAGRWTFLNRAWTDITGFSVAESLGQNCLQNVNPDDREKYEAEIQHLLAGEKDFCRHQVRFLTQNGDYRWLEAHVRCSDDAAGKLQGVSGLLRDVTERKQHEQELECMVAVTQALRQANTRAQILPIILDQVGELLQAGGAMFVIHPRQDSKQIELAWGAWQALSGRALPPELRLADFTADSGDPFIIADARNSLPEQYAAWLHPHWALLGVPVMNADQVTGVLWLGRQHPFTTIEGRLLQAIAGIMAAALDRARLLETLEQQVIDRTQELVVAHERLQELNQLKTKFIDDVSHELRTPTTAISLYLDLLARGNADKRESYLAVLRESSKRLNQIVESILQFSQLTETAVAQNPSVIDLNKITADVVSRHRPRAQKNGLDLTFLPAAVRLSSWGIAGLLSQAIDYLLDNAIKYTRDGSVTIRTYLDEDQQLAYVEIKDTGMGIEPDELERVFDRFYRGQKVSQLTTPGAGLGLSLARKIVIQSGGKLEIDSEPGRGTRVRLSIPLVG